MFKAKRKSNFVLLTLMVLIMAVMTLVFCLPNNVMAEEPANINEISTRGASKDGIYIPAIGNFKEGDRQYGGYIVTFEANKVADKVFDVIVQVGFVTEDYKTDKYYIKNYSFEVFSSDVAISNVSHTSGVSAGRISVTQTISSNKIVYNAKCDADKEKDMINNMPIVTSKFRITINGSNPQVGINVYSMDLIGYLLAKDTKINTSFIKLEVPINNSNMTDSRPVYRYKATYNNKSFIVGAAYASWGGPVPSYWAKPVGNL